MSVYRTNDVMASYPRIPEYDAIRAHRKLTFLELHAEHCQWLKVCHIADAKRSVGNWDLQPFFRHTQYKKSNVQYVNIVLQRIQDMARGNAKSKQSKRPGSNEVEFVSIRLSDEDKAALAEKEPMTAHEFFGMCDTLVAEGYKISVSMQNNGSVNFTATCRDSGHVNEGKALSGWGDSVISAAMSFLYKHDDLSGGDWAASASPDSFVSKFG